VDKVFGVGLGKTGTKTLKYALMELGFKRAKKCKQKYTCLYRDGNYKKLIKIAEGANNVSDHPWALIYKELAEWFPGAYFILTVRKDVDAWYNSVMRHIATRGMSALNFKNIFKMDIKKINPTKLKNFYLKHNEDVQRYFNNHTRFETFCWENGDGWEKLIKHLDMAEIGQFFQKKPFVWENKSKK